MEHANSANRSRDESPFGKSSSSSKRNHKDAARSTSTRAVRQKDVPKTVNPARPLRKIGSKSKSSKLVCRYCGSDDLAPSFIKRRDRRCRKCFSKRYGSAAQPGKGKVKK